MINEINFNDLTYYFTNPNLAAIKFIGFTDPLDIYDEIKNGNISIKMQRKIKWNLNQV